MNQFFRGVLCTGFGQVFSRVECDTWSSFHGLSLKLWASFLCKHLSRQAMRPTVCPHGTARRMCAPFVRHHTRPTTHILFRFCVILGKSLGKIWSFVHPKPLFSFFFLFPLFILHFHCYLLNEQTLSWSPPSLSDLEAHLLPFLLFEANRLCNIFSWFFLCFFPY